MANNFEFYLSDEDMDRLFYVKNEMEKKNDLTGNEFAKEIIQKYLYKNCPQVPENDENGDYANL